MEEEELNYLITVFCPLYDRRETRSLILREEQDGKRGI
jgi:hypothetical protein